LQEDADESHHSVLIYLGLIGTATLLHTVFQENMYEFLWQFHMPT